VLDRGQCLLPSRQFADLTQPQLAGITGTSVTSVGHAEAGNLWQSRTFWEHAELFRVAQP
jgi:hypothetical protein